MYKKVILCVIALLACVSVDGQSAKREFRGAWIQCVNGQFQGMSPSAMQARLANQLNACQAAGINAIIFQVRAEADALYRSSFEPWSRFLTGTQGQDPGWDPLAWMVEQCHLRQMELHAWINPYRAKTKGTKMLSTMHPYVQHPEWFVSYNGQLYFDPGIDACREYICKVVADIVSHYDIDAIHMDDYFYPYPNAGEKFNDDASYAQYGHGFPDRGNWRRDNVNRLVRDIHLLVRQAKPWVKFGVSPFGIYRNQQSSPIGSNTRGLQNYDDLYADILLWVEKEWIDYNIPQVYWEIGHSAADYATLVAWWDRYAGKRPLYIGQDVERTAKAGQLQQKMAIQRASANVQGSCQWYAAALQDNLYGYTDQLRQYHPYVAIPPTSPFIDDKAPKKPRKAKIIWTDDGPVLCWTAPKAKQYMDQATRYIVYRFLKGEPINLEDASKIVRVTNSTFYLLPYAGGATKYTYVVTALDRLHNESKPVKKKIRL